MLSGATVLVIEEEFLIALDIERMLQALSVKQVLFARDAEEAQGMRIALSEISLAIVEINSWRQHSLASIDRYLAAGIKVVLSTADSALRNGVRQFPGTPVVCKPMTEQDLVQAIGIVLMKRD